MGGVVYYVATSLDGFISGPNHEIDWLFDDDDYGYTEFLASVDVLVMGRATYDVCLGFDPWPYPEHDVYVVTHRPVEPRPRVTAFSGDPNLLLDRLAARSVWLVGGGDLAGQVRRAHRIDRYVISVHPVWLGRGIPLFPPDLPREELVFEGSTSWRSGLCQLRYRRAQPA